MPVIILVGNDDLLIIIDETLKFNVKIKILNIIKNE